MERYEVAPDNTIEAAVEEVLESACCVPAEPVEFFEGKYPGAHVIPLTQMNEVFEGGRDLLKKKEIGCKVSFKTLRSRLNKGEVIVAMYEFGQPKLNEMDTADDVEWVVVLEAADQKEDIEEACWKKLGGKLIPYNRIKGYAAVEWKSIKDDRGWFGDS